MENFPSQNLENGLDKNNVLKMLIACVIGFSIT